MKPILGIGLGEAAGIGPELVAKMCAAKSFHKYCTPVIIGDKRVLESGMRIANADFTYVPIQEYVIPADRS